MEYQPLDEGVITDLLNALGFAGKQVFGKEYTLAIEDYKKEVDKSGANTLYTVQNIAKYYMHVVWQNLAELINKAIKKKLMHHKYKIDLGGDEKIKRRNTGNLGGIFT